MKEKFTYSILVLCSFSWSFLYILTRLLNNINYINVSFFRFAFGFICFFPIYFFIKKSKKIPIGSSDFFHIIIIVIINGIASTAMALAAKYSDASINSIFFTLNPLFVALFAPLLIKERNTIINYLGIIIALFGVFFIITQGGIKLLNFWQIKTFYSLILGIFFDGVLIGIATNLIKKYVNKYSIWEISFYSMISNTIFLGVISIIYGSYIEIKEYSFHQWLWLFLVGLFPTAIAFSTFYYGIKNIGATKASAFKLLTPIFAAVLGIIFLKEKLYWYIIVGGITTISGLYLTQKK